MKKPVIDYVWKDRKRTFLGLPWSFTKYRVSAEKIYVETGVFTINQEEIRLYRIMDLTLRKSFGQRMFGLGTIHLCTADKSTPEFDIKSIKRPDAVKEMLSRMVEEERDRKKIVGREYMAGDDNDMDEDGMIHE